MRIPVRTILVAALLLPPLTARSTGFPPVVGPDTVASHLQIQAPQPFPDMSSNYQQTVVIPQQQAAQAALEAAQAAQAAEAAQLTQSAYAAPSQAVDGLVGAEGYALNSGNCVLEPGINNPGFGDPIDWPVLYAEPAIGRTALFIFNHTGYIVGLWSNGDLEIRHQNWQGTPQTRFPRSTFRGYR